MSISLTVVTRFFRRLIERRFAEAERVLEQIKKGAQKTDWDKGYLQALNGMLLAARASDDDRHLFLSSIKSSKKDELQKYRREFLKYTKSELYAEYDRGFFSAWVEYTRLTFKLKKNN